MSENLSLALSQMQIVTEKPLKACEMSISNVVNLKEKVTEKAEITNELITQITDNGVIENIGEKVSTILGDLPLTLSRMQTVIEKPFKAIDEKAIAKIKERSKEINEKMYHFSKKNSQTTRKLMTLQMLNGANSTYRILRDILANAERKQQALTENIIRMKKDEVKVKRLSDKLKKDVLTENEVELIKVDIVKKTISLVNGLSYIEGALKELGIFQDAYEQIKKNKNIPDDWSEYDFEKAEIEAHIRNGFRLCLRDFITNGRMGMGTIEYLEQFGINPIEAVYHVKIYIAEANEKLNKVNHRVINENSNISEHIDEMPNYDDFYGFLNRMGELYKNHYVKACRNLGLDDEIVSTDFIVRNAKNNEELSLLEEK